MKYISSLHNPRIKSALKLRDRRARLSQSRTLIDGTRELSRAVAAGVKIVELFVCPELCDARGGELAEELEPRAETMQVSRPVFEKLAFGDRQEGLVAVAQVVPRSLADWQPPPQPLIGVLESLEKPGNVGAVLRSADGAGLSAVIVAGRGTDLFNPNVVRASLGTIFSVPVFSAGSEECLKWLKRHGIAIYAARVDAERSYTDVDFGAAAAIVLGSESKGLATIWQGADVSAISLPMRGVADSLNVSATAAILFYEGLRQRTLASSGRQSR